MKRVLLAQNAGFCSGVQRAVALALRAARRQRTVYTLGELIHNRQVVEALKKHGVVPCNDISSLKKGDIVLIRSHGIEKSIREELEGRGVELIDATCPKVKRIHSIIRRHAAAGERVIIFGDRGHPEVMALLSEAPDALLLSSKDELDGIPNDGRPICLVAQSTQDKSRFEEVAEELKRRFDSVREFDTICTSTAERQEELRRLLRDADGVVVVGGRHSANTRRLAEIAERAGKKTYRVETAEEIDERVKEHKRIVVAAGASTPVWVIKDVMKKISHLVGERISLFENILRVLVRGNFSASLAAAALTSISLTLLHLKDISIVAVSALYVFCVHTANQLIASREEPFLKITSSLPMLRALSSAVAVAIALAITLHYGIAPTLLFVLAAVAGTLYSVDILPVRFMLRSFKDIPGSKEVLCATGWAFVASIIPITAYELSLPYHKILALFVLPFFPAYLRSILFDVRQIEKDRLMGKETTILALGSKTTKRVLLILLSGWVVLILLLSLLHIFNRAIYYALFMPAAFGLILFLRRLRLLHHELLFESALDSSIIVTALLLSLL